MITLHQVLIITNMLFLISIFGLFFNRQNLILILMCIELLFLSINTQFLVFSRYLGNIEGQIFVIFILTVAAAEAAIGLALFVNMYRHKKTINVQNLNLLRG